MPLTIVIARNLKQPAADLLSVFRQSKAASKRRRITSESTMEIEYALLADGAQAVSGKLFVLGGGWNIFRAQSFPAPAQIAVAAGVTMSPTEAGKHPIKLVLADEAGVPVVPEFNGQFDSAQPGPDYPPGLAIKVPLAMNIGLAIPRPGTYRILLTVGRATAQLSFEAIFVGQKVAFSLPGMGQTERGN